MGRSPQSCGCQHGRVQRLIVKGRHHARGPRLLIPMQGSFSFIKSSRKNAAYRVPAAFFLLSRHTRLTILRRILKTLFYFSPWRCSCCVRIVTGVAPLLRVSRDRPRRRAAEERNELAASHSITSSARASRVGGISRPSDFAVFRLTTSWYLVGA